MTWSDLKIRNKVSLGFGVVILLSVISSLVFLFNLLRVESEINQLSTKYIPSVNESSKMDHFWEGTKGLMTALDLSGNFYYNNVAEKQIESFTLALEKLITLGDTTTSKLSSRGIDLQTVQKLTNDFKTKRINYVNAEKVSQASFGKIISLFHELNKKGKDNKGSLGIQRTVAQGNFIYAQLFSDVISKKGTSVAAIIDENPDFFKKENHPAAINSLMKNISSSVEEFLPQYKKARLAELKRYEAGKELMWEVRKSSELGLDYLLEMGDRSSKIVLQEKRLIIIAIFIVILIGLALSYFLANSISRPMEQGIAQAEKVASGDLNIKFAINRKDEIGRLAAALDTMVANIKTVVEEIRMSANKMVIASERLTKESAELSEGASEQASAAEEVSSSMEEMHANIQQNTENSKETEKIAIHAADGIKLSNESSQLAQQYVEDITNKISVIGDIAFQTNILALNAAVEAARAGQEGRGFAVVAAEVRKLAERSQAAANEINKASQNTINSSKETIDNLHAITPEIQKTANLVQEITTASLEQVSGVEQINNALQQLNQITQRNAVNSEEINTAARELEELSGMLKNSISVFKLNESEKEEKKTSNIASNKPKNDVKKQPSNPSKAESNSKNKNLLIDLGRDFQDDNDYDTF